MTNAFAEWQIDDADYPDAGRAEDRMRFLLGYAILAPSGHNTQPWLFRLLPEPSDPDLLARVAFGPRSAPSEADVERFRAITRRRTTRQRYPEEPLPHGLATRLTAAAEADGCELAIIDNVERKQDVANLVGEGDRAQFGNAQFRRELAAWVHSRRSASRDGMSGAAFGMPDVLSSVGGLVIRTFDMGNGQAAKDVAIAAGSPALLVLATSVDQPENWLRAGLALSSILLDITGAGWTSAYLNQPVETDELRPRLRKVAGVAGYPQLLFRVGRAPLIDPAVRRPVSDTLIRSSLS